jgi:hypothetical protein
VPFESINDVSVILVPAKGDDSGKCGNDEKCGIGG